MSDKEKLDLSKFLNDYLSDAKEGFQRINSALLTLEKDPSQKERLDEIFRAVHTLKSSSAMLEFSDIAELAHASEDLLDQMRQNEVLVNQETIDLLFEAVDTLETMVKERAEGKSGGTDFKAVAAKVKQLAQRDTLSGKREVRKTKTALMPAIEKVQTVKVNVDLLDSLFNLTGELIITKNRINNIVANTAPKELKTALATIDRMTNELQENVSAARLVPADEIFQKFPRMVRDLAKDAGKEIELIIEGREIELDKAVLDAISEPLIHLLRNAIDHGIEPTQERQKHKKTQHGTIKLIARRTENHVLIDVEDDGSGIDVTNIKQGLVRKGLVKPEEAESLEDKDVLNLLFKPGVSSTEKVTDLSGRGVGLDVVRNSAERLGGTVEVATQKGKGTRFTLRLPLTTAIIQTLMVGVGEHDFAIPTDIVQEILEIEPEDIKEIQAQKALLLHNEVVPFFKLGDVLNIHVEEAQAELLAVVIARGDKFISLGVDRVTGIIDNVVKPFDPIAQKFKGFSGGTILEDGRVSLLLDIPMLFGLETLQGGVI